MFIIIILTYTSLDGVFYWLSYDFATHVRIFDALNTVEGLFERRSLPVGVGSESRTHLFLLNDSRYLTLLCQGIHITS